MKTHTLFNKTMVAGAACVIAMMGIPLTSQAEDVPLSHVAEPGVYKVLAENELFRVVLATWKPGQRDALHSHPANAVYRLTDCKNQIYKADGSKGGGGEVKAGSVNLQAPVTAHSFENAGTTECQMLIVERK